MTGLIRRLPLLGLFFLCHVAQASVELVIDEEGELAGARGLSIEGSLYDVEFLDGNFQDLFDPDHLTFSSVIEGEPFYQALHNQVFTGYYDDNPAATRGCEMSPWLTFNFCAAATPYSVEFNADGELSKLFAFGAFNQPDPSYGDPVGDFGDTRVFVEWTRDTWPSAEEEWSSDVFNTYARWTPSSNKVPELDAAGMLHAFALLFGALMIARERRGSKQKSR
jgi:hypothetical protein